MNEVVFPPIITWMKAEEFLRRTCESFSTNSGDFDFWTPAGVRTIYLNGSTVHWMVNGVAIRSETAIMAHGMLRWVFGMLRIVAPTERGQWYRRIDFAVDMDGPHVLVFTKDQPPKKFHEPMLVDWLAAGFIDRVAMRMLTDYLAERM